MHRRCGEGRGQIRKSKKVPGFLNIEFLWFWLLCGSIFEDGGGGISNCVRCCPIFTVFVREIIDEDNRFAQ